jgi:hypothetical protein
MKITLQEFQKARRAQRVELESHEVELALAEDLRTSENDLKTALLNTSSIETKFEEAKKNLKSEATKARSLAEKFKANATDLGLDPTKNVIYKTVEAYLQSDLIKNLK